MNYFIHNINPIIFNIGKLSIAWYGVCYVISFILGYFLLKKNYQKTNVNIKPDDYESFILHIMLGVVIGGRIGYVLFYQLGFYLAHPIQIFYVNQGGMSFHGGLLGVIVASLLFCKRKKYHFYTLADPAMPIVAIGVGIVRIANFINGELYGKVTTMRWGVIFKLTDFDINPLTDLPFPRHPSQIYEAFLEGFLMAVLLQILLTKIKIKGIIFWLFIGIYGVVRYLIEYIRVPDDLPLYDNGLILGYFSMGQVLSLLMLIVAISGIVVLKIKK